MRPAPTPERAAARLVRLPGAALGSPSETEARLEAAARPQRRSSCGGGEAPMRPAPLPEGAAARPVRLEASAAGSAPGARLCDGSCHDLRCGCGSLLARRVQEGVELKCRRCKRTLVLPLGDG